MNSRGCTRESEVCSMVNDDMVNAMQKMIDETDNPDEKAGMEKMMNMLCEGEWW